MNDQQDNSSGKTNFRGLEAGQRLLYIAVILSALLMSAKFLAWYLTSSSAILSDALESIINVIAAAFALGSVILSSKPPDASHPYGHGKIEYFSAGFEGALIILAAISIFHQGALKIFNPQELPRLDAGIAIIFLVSVLNAVLGYYLVRTGRSIGSDAVLAHGKHIITDVFTSGGVILGLLTVMATGYWFADGLIACIVGVNITVSGIFLVKRSFSGLMHESDRMLLEDICEVLTQHRKDLWIDMHQLRAWRSGQRVFIDFHLILPRDLSLEKAHAEVKELESFFSLHFGDETEIFVHLDPCEDPECTVCSKNPCEIRKDTNTHKHIWKLDLISSRDHSEDQTRPKSSS